MKTATRYRGRLYRVGKAYVVANLSYRLVSDDLTQEDIDRLKQGEIKLNFFDLDFYLDDGAEKYQPVNIKSL